MLKYTGHPIRDVGVAVITAFSDQQHPEDLVEEHLYDIADYMHKNYPKHPWKSYLAMAFTQNSWFNQNSFNPDIQDLSEEEKKERQQKRDDKANLYLRQWAAQPTDEVVERDVFTGEPAIAVKLSKELPVGRAGRAQIPLILGDKTMNFYANGSPGLPVSGTTMLCLQAFPLGAALCGPNLLIVHSDNPNVILAFAREFWIKNQEAFQIASMDSKTKMPSARPRTLLIETLREILRKRRAAKNKDESFSITAYLLSNDTREPRLKIDPLPAEVVSFIIVMERDYEWAWNILISQAQVVSKKISKPFNRLYEDLFTLPEKAATFFRKYLLRKAIRYVKQEISEPDIRVLWEISLELSKRFLMDKEQLAKIQKLGDGLKDYVIENAAKGRRFFNEFRSGNYSEFRNRLCRVLKAEAVQGRLLFFFNDYIDIFQIADDAPNKDWKLARDLIYMQMIEQLHHANWSGFASEEVKQSLDDTEDDEGETHNSIINEEF